MTLVAPPTVRPGESEVGPVPGPPWQRWSRQTSSDRQSLRATLFVVGGFVLAVIVTIVVGLAIGTGSSSGTTVTLKDFAIVMPRTLPAGRQTFALTNAGPSPHELVMFQTDLDAASLPLDPNGDVDEESSQLHSVADSGAALRSGATKTVTTRVLTPGHYVAVCNLSGHYHFGMRLNVEVR
jgi:hypothetical protein